MIPENPPPPKYWYRPYEGYEKRSQHRLKDDLGFDEAAAEVVLNLRRQMIELQARVRQLETELAVQYNSQRVRLAHYREVCYEATWIEIEFKE